MRAEQQHRRGARTRAGRGEQVAGQALVGAVGAGRARAHDEQAAFEIGPGQAPGAAPGAEGDGGFDIRHARKDAGQGDTTT